MLRAGSDLGTHSHPHILAPAWHISLTSCARDGLIHLSMLNGVIPLSLLQSSWIVWSLPLMVLDTSENAEKAVAPLRHRNLHKAPYSHRGLWLLIKTLHPPRRSKYMAFYCYHQDLSPQDSRALFFNREQETMFLSTYTPSTMQELGMQ